MSASSRPTLAPLRLKAQARLMATVDLPTPPFPDATAIACLTPGMTWLGCGRLKADRTLAVIFRSTAVTPGRSATSLCAIVWKRSRTGQAGVVSSNVKATLPSAPMTRSLIMPRLTTSRPRSGSWIAPSTARTWSELGGFPLLGTEDHRRPQREHPEQDEEGHDKRVGACAGDDRRASGGTDAHVTSRHHQRRPDAYEREQPQRKELDRQSGRSRRDDRDEEGDQQDELQDREIPVRLVEAAKAERSVGTVPCHQRDQRRRPAQTGGEKQSAEHPRVAPDRLIADAEEHARVGREQQGEDPTDDVEGSAQDPAHRPAGVAHGVAVSPVEHERLEGRHGRENAEHHQRPYAHRHRRPVFEVQALVSGCDVDEHVPELPPARSEVGGEEHRTEQNRDEARVEAKARRRLVARLAHQAQERRESIGASGKAGEEEVAEDVPRPLRRSHEVLRGEVHQDVPRRLKATMPAITPSTAVMSAPMYPPTLLRVGSPALSAFGSP